MHDTAVWAWGYYVYIHLLTATVAINVRMSFFRWFGGSRVTSAVSFEVALADKCSPYYIRFIRP